MTAPPAFRAQPRQALLAPPAPKAPAPGSHQAAVQAARAAVPAPVIKGAFRG
ncbi:hypothetical protein [Methylobacterium sp. WSM2598]|uniref:hypothetical protein n=1 Tax=Methylobacterium sp. WSM2598 TaxID=398261 RepID=UPI00039D00E9|nr:hypothetical protein [Methylobacterium sp. WSM2598]